MRNGKILHQFSYTKSQVPQTTTHTGRSFADKRDTSSKLKRRSAADGLVGFATRSKEHSNAADFWSYKQPFVSNEAANQSLDQQTMALVI